jgi:hypothetical protein
MFEYESNGIIKIRACALVKFKKAYPILFENNSKAFIKNKALRGILDFIVIKNSYLNMDPSYTRSGIQPVVVYIDTFNRVWLEEELLYQEEALDVSEIYWQRVNYEADYVGDRTCTAN